VSRLYAAILTGPILLISACSDYTNVPVASPVTDKSLYQPSLEAEYRISPGDALLVNSYFEPSLKQPVVVQPDGEITLLLVGSVLAAGKTPAQLSRELTSAYEAFIPATDVSATVTDIATQAVYIGGEVKQPSMETMRAQTTVLAAIIEAGGFTPSANRQQILIVHPGNDNRIHVVQENIEAVLDNQAGDIYLRRHDIVYVPKTQIAKVDEWVEQYINGLIPKQTQFLFGYQFLHQNVSGTSTGATTVITPVVP
jgi:polysaccharide biosynthesis/export protein